MLLTPSEEIGKWNGDLASLRKTNRAGFRVIDIVVINMSWDEWSIVLDFELELAHVRILNVNVSLFIIITTNIVPYRLSPLFCLIRSSQFGNL
ncbi:hypothetical protein J6590_085769 [Homalodisca vitripennis]|nr:hypothetical protein J6590_085769 [Homalodisca vitripennis]